MSFEDFACVDFNQKALVVWRGWKVWRSRSKLPLSYFSENIPYGIIRKYPLLRLMARKVQHVSISYLWVEDSFISLFILVIMVYEIPKGKFYCVPFVFQRIFHFRKMCAPHATCTYYR